MQALGVYAHPSPSEAVILAVRLNLRSVQYLTINRAITRQVFLRRAVWRMRQAKWMFLWRG